LGVYLRKSLVLVVVLSLFLIPNTYAICSDCNDNNYETGDTYCACDEWEECKDIYHKSTAYVDDTGEYGTDYCYDENSVVEYYINCKRIFKPLDSLEYDIIDCPSGYSCSDGACVYTSCDYDPECGYSYWSDCYSTTSFYYYDLETECDGGCQIKNYLGSYSCWQGSYCSGNRYDDYPCYSCSQICDNYCQASTCYGTDPDCDSDGNPTLACCGNGICDPGESFSNCPNDCKLGEGEGDCDSDADCDGDLYCSCIGYCSGWLDWDTDYCCPYGSYWNGTHCHTPQPDIRVEPTSLVFNR